MPNVLSARRLVAPSRPIHRDASILVAVAVLLYAAASARVARHPPIAHAQPATQTTCTFEDVTSTLDRPAIPIGGTVRLALHWRWNCTTGAPPPRDVLVVVDPTTASAGDAEAKVRMANLRAALARFAGTLGWAGGGRFGTISAACPPVTVSPMASGEAAHAAWRDAFGSLASASTRDIVGAYTLAAATLNGLPPVEGQAPPVVLVVDAGGATCQGAAPPDPGVVDVCPLLTERGALVVTLGLSSASERFPWCNAPGWFFRSASSLGADLSAILDDVAARIMRDEGPPARVSTEVVVDTFNWEFVKAEPPTDFSFPDVAWERDVNRQMSGEMSVAVTMRTRANITPGGHAISLANGNGPWANVIGNDGFERSRQLPNPAVCVYRPGRQAEDCGAAPTSTTPPMPSATAALSPTSVAGPTALPTAAPSNTPPVAPSATPPPATPTGPAAAGRRLWLPCALLGPPEP